MRKEYRGAAVSTTLGATIGTGDVSFTITNATGWPDGTIGPFVVTLDRGTPNEEKILCTNRTGTTINVTARGYDGTTAAGHNAGATAEHTIDAASLDEVNAFVNGNMPDGTVGAPALAFASDPDTGIYRSTTDEIAFSTAGIQRLRIRAGGKVQIIQPVGTAFAIANTDAGGDIFQINSGGEMALSSGSAAAPSVGFIGDSNTGIYRETADPGVSITHDGTRVARFRSDYIWLEKQVRAGDGTATAPGLSFGSDTDTGFYRPTGNTISLGLGGAEHYHWATTAFLPVGDNTKKLGDSGWRWSQLWAGTTTIATSDESLKSNIQDIELGLDFVKAVRPITANLEGGTRPHAMFSAQQVRSALDGLGIDDFAGYIDPAVGGDSGPLGLRYSEFIPPAYRALQELSEENTELRARIEALESRLT